MLDQYNTKIEKKPFKYKIGSIVKIHVGQWKDLTADVEEHNEYLHLYRVRPTHWYWHQKNKDGKFIIEKAAGWFKENELTPLKRRKWVEEIQCEVDESELEINPTPEPKKAGRPKGSKNKKKRTTKKTTKAQVNKDPFSEVIE